MRVKDYIYTNVTSELRSISQQSNSQIVREKIPKPIKTAAQVTALTFSYGLALTFIAKKMKIFKSHTSNTMFINGIAALTIGLLSVYKDMRYAHNMANEDKPVFDKLV